MESTFAPTFNMSPPPPTTTPHMFLTFAEDLDREILNRVALQLANFYSKRDWSRKRWHKSKGVTCRWELKDKDDSGTGRIVATEQVSHPFHPNDFVKDLRTSSTFNQKKYNLPEPKCSWLDNSISAATNFHAVQNTGQRSLTFQLVPNLANFPLSPSLDREGVMYTSFQGVLIHRVANLRKWLVENSHSDLTDREEWFQNFRTLVNECVSLVDNTLHQIYFKAEYDRPPSWKFVRDSLGERHGRRLMDKIKWVHQITGKQLDAPKELCSLRIVKELRNHLQHFDPPCFSASFEEIAEWLNHVLGVARLLRKIRQCANALPSIPLIELLLQKKVVFSPRDPGRRRVSMDYPVGYASTSAETLAKKVPPVSGPHVIVLQSSREENLL
jgi:hypothetical protein